MKTRGQKCPVGSNPTPSAHFRAWLLTVVMVIGGVLAMHALAGPATPAAAQVMPAAEVSVAAQEAPAMHGASAGDETSPHMTCASCGGGSMVMDGSCAGPTISPLIVPPVREARFAPEALPVHGQVSFQTMAVPRPPDPEVLCISRT